jgi:phage terminase large subunit-like protein
MVRIVKGDWNDSFLAELEDFINDKNQKDDQVDATSDAFNTLCKQIQLPTFAVPAWKWCFAGPKTDVRG